MNACTWVLVAERVGFGHQVSGREAATASTAWGRLRRAEEEGAMCRGSWKKGCKAVHNEVSMSGGKQIDSKVSEVTLKFYYRYRDK